MQHGVALLDEHHLVRHVRDGQPDAFLKLSPLMRIGIPLVEQDVELRMALNCRSDRLGDGLLIPPLRFACRQIALSTTTP